MMNKQIIENAMAKKTLVGIRTFGMELNESIIGFIEELGSERFVIKEIDEFGRFIGKTIMGIDEILVIEYDDKYHNQLMFLQTVNESFNDKDRITVCGSESSFLPILTELCKLKEITTFYFENDEYVSGIPAEFDDKCILIHNIGYDGVDEGFSCHYLSRLTSLRYNSIHEKRISLLRNTEMV